MELSAKQWNDYVNKLSKINSTAAKKMQAFINQNGMDDRTALIDYAYALATSYGEASGALAAEMYDAIAEASNKSLPAAEIAPTATYSETAKAVNGTLENGYSTVPSTVGRLVKQAGADTTLQNALRDGAKFAWIPHGDSCAFCITLAANGWRKMSKKALRGDHAEHIHANCDCEYAISFDDDPHVEGYDPEYYQEIYDNAEGKSSQDKINAIRREQYAANKAKETVTQKPDFVPAKSIKEAEEYASQFIEGGKYSSVSYDGVDLQYANEFNRAMNDVLSQYEPKYKLRDIKPMNMREKAFKGTTADAAYRWGSCDLFYNKGYFKSVKDFNKHLSNYKNLLDQVLPNIDALIGKYENESGFLANKQLSYLRALKASGRTNVSLAQPYETMVHEIGHYLDDNLFRTAFKKQGIDVGESAAKYAINISGYATESINEYIAESFLAYWKGETDILDPAIINVFERLKK